MLRRDLVDVVIKPGSNGCAVLSGTLNDPYTGTSFAFQRGPGSSAEVQIDHMVSLSDAWQTGAQQWDEFTRRNFANDPRNLQATLGYSPIKTGLAFLPMIGAIMLTATTSTALVLPRTGPRLPVTLGMVLGTFGLVLFTQIGVDTAYATHVLPGLVVTGLGLGLVFACCFEVGTMGVRASDSGVASAMVNTTQQVGGSIGTALLSTVFATAVTTFVATSTDPQSPASQAAAQVEGYATAFWWAAGIFLISAVVCGLLMTKNAPAHDPDVPRVAA
jgi:hypothetical protein